MENLLSIETKSVAFGYKLVNEFHLPKDCHLIEAAVLGPNCFWILLQGDLQGLREVTVNLDQTHTSFKEMALLQEVCPTVKQALYGLQQMKIKEYLTIVETTSLTTLLQVAQDLTSQQVNVIELTQGRGMNGQCVGYFTGLSGTQPDLVLQAKAKQGLVSHFETLSPVSPLLKDYFSIENI